MTADDDALLPQSAPLSKAAAASERGQNGGGNGQNGTAQDPSADGTGTGGTSGQPGIAKPIADQAAAMMVQDMRTFLQGTEQILTIAIARALAEVVQSDGARGTIALETCKKFLKDLPDFAKGIGSAASEITNDFK